MRGDLPLATVRGTRSRRKALTTSTRPGVFETPKNIRAWWSEDLVAQSDVVQREAAYWRAQGRDSKSITLCKSRRQASAVGGVP
jgi:hypothetical protein